MPEGPIYQPSVMRPLRLEIDELSDQKGFSEHLSRARRVVRMYQDQACNLPFNQQRRFINLIHSGDYQLQSRVEDDARLHLLVSPAYSGNSALEPCEWLLLYALYDEDQLDELVAVFPKVGERPPLPASRYDEYRVFYPVTASPRLTEVPPLDQRPMRMPPVSSDVAVQTNGQAEKSRVSAGFDWKAKAPSTSHKKDQQKTGEKEDLNARDLKKISDNVDIVAKQISTNGEVIHYFLQRLQTVEKENEDLKAHIRDLERKMASMSSAAGVGK